MRSIVTPIRCRGLSLFLFVTGLVACNDVFNESASGGSNTSTTLVLGDCDADGIPDQDEIALGTQLDENGNGSPDECEPLTRPTAPGSLLILPEFKGTSQISGQSIVTVTNIFDSPVDVKVSFIGPDGSSDVVFVHLEAKDTYSGVVGGPLPTLFETQIDRGYVQMVAVDGASLRPIAHDGLLAGVLIFQGAPGFSDVSVAHDAYCFQAIPEDGLETDLDSDGTLDLDGLEYTPAPRQVIVPRFVGQRVGVAVGGTGTEAQDFYSAIILIPLVAQDYLQPGLTTIDMEIFNDNANVVGNSIQEVSVRVWKRVRLEELSLSFLGDEIRFTSNHAPDEVAGISGVRPLEAGWVRMTGNRYEQNGQVTPDPAVLVFLLASPGFSARFSSPGHHGIGRSLSGGMVW